MSSWTSVSVDRGVMGVRTLRELVDSWDFHVRRLEREARAHYPSGSRDLRDVWGVYDLIAANVLRDDLERLMLGLDEGDQAEMRAAIEPIDSRFLGFTVPDVERVVQRIDGEGASSAWWWDRIPPSGPVLDDILPMLRPDDER